MPSSVTAPVFLTLGVLAVVLGLLAYRAQRRYLRRAVPVTGVVQSIRAEHLDRGGTVYFPVVRFTTAAGATITAESHTSQGGLRIGQNIPILYDPQNPQNVEINAFFSRWVLVLVAGAFALVSFAIGGAALAR